MLKKLLKIAALLFAALLVLLTALAVVGIPIGLDFIKPELEQVAQKNLGRAVKFAGPITLGVSLWPSLSMKDVSIAGPPGFEGYFARAEMMEVRVDLLPLLSGDLRLGRVAARGVTVNLRESLSGKKSWDFELPAAKSGQDGQAAQDSDGVPVRLQEVRDFSLEDIKVSYVYGQEPPMHYELISLSARGSQSQPLSLQAKANIAGTPVSLSYKAALGPETGQKARFRQGRFSGQELSSEMELTVGMSHLRGKGSLWDTGKVLGLKAVLVSDLVQLNDFITPASAKTPKQEAAPQAEPDPAAQAKEPAPSSKRKLAAGLRALMRNCDVDLKVRAKKVLSGKDELGGGELALRIKDGRLALKPVQVRIPGGSIEFDLELADQGKGLQIELGIKASNFDLGVLAKRYTPKAVSGGVLNLDILLRGRSPDLAGLLPTASGHFYFAVQPEDLSADLFDLWAVNLLAAILPKLDEGPQSKVNCLVGRMKMKDGVMTDEIIMMDTTRMTVEGKGKINFAEQRAEFVFKPTSKQPEFFAAATPVRASGAFNDFGITISKMDLVISMFSMATSPLHVPLRRIFSSSPSPDGKTACAQAMAVAVPQAAGGQTQ